MLTKLGAVGEAESPHTSDDVPVEVVFHPAAGHGWMPPVVTAEITQRRPYLIDLGVNYCRSNDGDFHLLP